MSDKCNTLYSDTEVVDLLVSFSKMTTRYGHVLTKLLSLESEYNAYHSDSDYWRGVKYAIDEISKVVRENQ